MSDYNKIKRLELLRKEMNETLNELKELMFRRHNNGCSGVWQFLKRKADEDEECNFARGDDR